MADFEPDRGPPKSGADALPPPAPPCTSAQSNIVTLNIVKHSINTYQDATIPGTETYMTPHVGIAPSPSTTMTDLAMTAGSFKYVINTLQLTPGTLWVRQSQHSQNADQTLGRPTNPSHRQPGNQPYTTHHDDPTTATPSHLEITSPTTSAQHPTQLHNRRLYKNNNLAININDKTILLNQSAKTTIRQHNDRCREERSKFHAARTTASNIQIPTQYARSYPHPIASPSQSSDQPVDFDEIAATIFEQLNQLEAIVRARYSSSAPNPLSAPTVHHDTHPSTHITEHSMTRNTRIDPLVPSKTIDTTESNPVLRSTMLADPTAPYNAASTYLPNMKPIQSDGCKLNHLLFTKTTNTTAISQCPPNPTSRVPASHTPTCHSMKRQTPHNLVHSHSATSQLTMLF